jgi:hypothetical protein
MNAATFCGEVNRRGASGREVGRGIERVTRTPFISWSPGREEGKRSSLLPAMAATAADAVAKKENAP